jgi:hypothetical protein
MPKKFSPEFRAKALRLVVDHREDYRSAHEARRKVSERLGLGAESCGGGFARPRSTTVMSRCDDGSGARDP